jgi:hypothetical protein
MSRGCGNDPRTRLTPGDRAAVEEFKAYLASRPCPGCEHRVHRGAVCRELVMPGAPGDVDECGCDQTEGAGNRG